MATLWAIIQGFRKEIRTLRTKINKGHRRTNFYSADRRRLLYIQQYDEQPTTVFFHYPELENADHTSNRRSYQPTFSHLYNGLLDKEPNAFAGRVVRAEYEGKRINKKIEYKGAAVDRTSFYVYENKKIKFPTQRIVLRGDWTSLTQEGAQNNVVMKAAYDQLGREASCDYYHMHNNSMIVITGECKYSSDVLDPKPCEIIYRNIPESSHKFGRLRVRWHEHSKFVDYAEAQSYSGKILRTYFRYYHVQHPRYQTYEMESGTLLPLKRYSTPSFIFENHFNLFQVTCNSSIYRDNHLLNLPNSPSSFLSKFRPKVSERKIYQGQPTTRNARIAVWKAWRRGELEGALAKMWDESILRGEKVLKSYWFWRDLGFLSKAKRIIEENWDSIAAVIEIENSRPDLRSQLILRVTDLSVFGIGGTSHLVANDIQVKEEMGKKPNKEILHVAAVDSGTFPADGGGVANCRRDLIDRLSGLVWHSYAEIGTPMKQILYQTETNMAELVLIPLWGEDLGGANESILAHIPYGQLVMKKWMISNQTIRRYFIPLLKQLIQGCNLVNPTARELDSYSSSLVNLYHYFQIFDWVVTWNHPLVVEAWRAEWLRVEEDRSKKTPLIDAEKPNVDDLDFARGLFIHLLLPISVPIDPLQVFHSTHHGIQSVMGIIARQLYGSSLIIWDHGMLWRERIKALSEVPQLSLFVRNSLCGLTKLIARVAYENCDIVTSCTSVGNPEWEVKIGGSETGNIDTVNMLRKMSPVVNGMETDRFKPNYAIEEKRPTVVMLSHVYDLKDVKNAIRAGIIIINEFKLTSYQLLIYGALDKDTTYVSECRDLIEVNGVGGNIFLLGAGAAPQVLPRGWIFLNSSKSEGLPLALGEAGLAGLPVVCTDVGGSRQVVSDGKEVYGRTVPPQNPMALARAQLEVMLMIGELMEVVNGEKLTQYLTLEDFQPLKPTGLSMEERIEAMRPFRRKLGMKYRAFVKANFGMEIYLRKHLHQIWLGSMRCLERRAQVSLTHNPDLPVHKRQLLEHLARHIDIGVAQETFLQTSLLEDINDKDVNETIEANRLTLRNKKFILNGADPGRYNNSTLRHHKRRTSSPPPEMVEDATRFSLKVGRKESLVQLYEGIDEPEVIGREDKFKWDRERRNMMKRLCDLQNVYDEEKRTREELQKQIEMLRNSQRSAEKVSSSSSSHLSPKIMRATPKKNGSFYNQSKACVSKNSKHSIESDQKSKEHSRLELTFSHDSKKGRLFQLSRSQQLSNVSTQSSGINGVRRIANSDMLENKRSNNSFKSSNIYNV